MALNVVQFEEITSLLQQVPHLVDRLESRRSGFVDGVHTWLKRVEEALENNRLPAVSQVAACRAMLMQAARGLINKEITFIGKPTLRKIRDATASMALQRCNQLLHDVIAERQAAYKEAERVARQLMVVAEFKGIIQTCKVDQDHQVFLQCVQQKLASDPDLASVYVHLVSLVGKYDVLIFLDRAISV